MTLALLPGFAESFLIVFARVGALIMLLPGLGERAIPARLRLAIALMIALMILPGRPAGGGEALTRLFPELAVGLVLGVSARFVMAAAETAGVFAAQSIGLSFAQNIDPSQGQQSEVLAGFMRMLAALVVFTTDLHHLAIAGVFESYRAFPPGAVLPAGDVAMLLLERAADMLAAAIRLAAPFLVFGLVFNLGVGIVGRMTPQIQLFYLAMPASILIGLLLLGTSLGAFAHQFQRLASEALGQILSLR